MTLPAMRWLESKYLNGDIMKSSMKKYLDLINDASNGKVLNESVQNKHTKETIKEMEFQNYVNTNMERVKNLFDKNLPSPIEKDLRCSDGTIELTILYQPENKTIDGIHIEDIVDTLYYNITDGNDDLLNYWKEFHEGKIQLGIEFKESAKSLIPESIKLINTEAFDDILHYLEVSNPEILDHGSTELTYKFSEYLYSIGELNKPTYDRGIVNSKLEQMIRDRNDDYIGIAMGIESFIRDNSREEVMEDLTDTEKEELENKREEIVKELKKDKESFKKQYGDDWKSVMYGTATNMAKKELGL